MARPLRIEYPDAVYHITSRGNARQNIYLEDEDRVKFIDILSKTVERFHWICHACCLMDNHYHLMIETPEANLSAGMRQLNGIYTQAFNRHHDKIGHLFQGRFKAILVEKQVHLLELSRYIVLNPVRAGIVNSAEDYLWSSYRETLRLVKSSEFLTSQWLLENFSPSMTKGRQLYRDFVNDGIKLSDSPWDKLTGQMFLGSDDFIQQVKNQSSIDTSATEFTSANRYAGHPDLASLFPSGEKLSKTQRNRLICVAHIEHGYKLIEIAGTLGIHYTTVSKVINQRKN